MNIFIPFFCTVLFFCLFVRSVKKPVAKSETTNVVLTFVFCFLMSASFLFLIIEIISEAH